MPEANVALVREVLEGWNRGSREAHSFWPNAEFDLSRWLFDVPSTWQGSAEADRRVDSLVGVWENFACAPESVRGVGDAVLAVVSLKMRGRVSGAEVKGRFAALFRLRDGRISRFAIYPDEHEAMAALADG